MLLSRTNLVLTLLVLGCAFISLLAMEGVLQLIGYPAIRKSGWRWDESPYKSEANQSDRRVNQLGLRGQPIQYSDSDYVILLLGDSYIEAGPQPFEDLPERILEDAFKQRHPTRNVKVFSIASAGWAQDQQLFWLSRYFESYRADLVINWITAVNDYWENSFIDRSVDMNGGPLKPTYRLSADGELEFVANPVSPVKTLEIARKAWAKIRFGPAKDYYMHAWIAGLPDSNLVPVPRSECPGAEIPQSELMASWLRGEGKVTAVTKGDIPVSRSIFSPFMVPRSHLEAYQITLTHRLLAEMKRSAATHGADFRVFYPSGDDLYQALKQVACVKSEAEGKFYRYDMRDPLAFISRSEVADLVIPVDVSTSTPTILSSQDWHMNRAANEKAMGGLASALMRSGLIK